MRINIFFIFFIFFTTVAVNDEILMEYVYHQALLNILRREDSDFEGVCNFIEDKEKTSQSVVFYENANSKLYGKKEKKHILNLLEEGKNNNESWERYLFLVLKDRYYILFEKYNIDFNNIYNEIKNIIKTENNIFNFLLSDLLRRKVLQEILYSENINNEKLRTELFLLEKCSYLKFLCFNIKPAKNKQKREENNIELSKRNFLKDSRFLYYFLFGAFQGLCLFSGKYIINKFEDLWKNKDFKFSFTLKDILTITKISHYFFNIYKYFQFKKDIDAYKKASLEDMLKKGNINSFMPNTDNKIYFIDVIGLYNAKKKLHFYLDFFKDKEKYSAQNITMPHGILFEGLPGTGKTLLAKAFAFEANLPFYYISGGEIPQKYVGEAEEKIRAIFATLRENQPAVLFIDEFDAIGSRDDKINAWMRPVINQLLTELDGIASKDNNIIVIGATNDSRLIDPALIRSGRFDFRVTFENPSLKDRYALLLQQGYNKNLDPKLLLFDIAHATGDFSSADLVTIMNNASFESIRKGSAFLMMNDIEDAIDEKRLGPLKVHDTYPLEERIKVAYHEAGHTVGMILQKDYPYRFYKVTIQSRSDALGVTHAVIPEKALISMTKENLEAIIVTSLAGRAADKIISKVSTSGAYSDLQNATNAARVMVEKYGMSDELGAFVVSSNGPRNSEETQNKIDSAIQKILENCEIRANLLINNNKALLKAIADNLIEKEILNYDDINRIKIELK